MKKNIARAVAVLMTLVLLGVAVFGVSELMQSKSSRIKYNDFYANNEDYDVLLCGSSHMMNTVYPMELWEHYGIRSYNIANSTEAVPTTYWVLKNALDHHKPKVVVMEVFIAGDHKVQPNNEAFLHHFFDKLPLSKNKVEALRDMLSKERIGEFLVDFSLYHSRWEELAELDFEPGRNLNKGAGAMVGHADGLVFEHTAEKGAVGKKSVEYLRKVKAMCDEEGIALVLMLSPYAATVDEQKNHNAMQEVADEMGVDFLNLIDKEIVDYSIDMFDRGHCNLAGGLRVTDYLGDYLITNYGDVIERGDQTTTDAWDVCYQEYIDDLEQAFVAENGFYNTLIRLQHEYFTYEIKVRNDSALLEDKVTCNYLERLDQNHITYCDELESDIIFDIMGSGQTSEAIHKEFDSKNVLVGTIKSE